MRFLILSLLILLFSCKKEPTTWQNELQAPIAYGRLDFSNLIQDDVLATNSDGTLQMFWQKDLIALNIDSLADIPDTTISKNFTIQVASITANPGFEFIDNVQNFSISNSEVELKHVILKEGKVYLELESPVTEATIIEVLIPAASKDNVTFSRTYEVQGGSTNSPTIIKDSVDFTGYDLDLTGDSGNEFNTMQIQFKVSIDPNGNTVTITDQDVIKMKAGFVNLVPSYARGYFGQHSFDENQDINIDILNSVIGGSIDIDQINFDLIIENSFDLTARGKINEIVSRNIKQNASVFLLHPEFSQWININPASGNWNTLQPYRKTFNFNSGNSNIEAFLENIPQVISIDFEGEINPLGNTTGGHDEMFPNSKLALRLEADFPIRLSANQFTLSDTVNIGFDNENETFQIVDGTLFIEGVNNFPFGASIELNIYDSTNNVLTSIPVSGEVPVPALDNNDKIVASQDFIISATLTEEQMNLINLHQKLIFRAVFNTSGSTTIPMYEDYFFDYKIKTQVHTQLSY